MKKKIAFIFFILFSPLALDATAHQPRLVMGDRNSASNPILIEEPEVSKAFYAQIEKSDQYYRIGSSKEFNLYLGLQLPDIPLQSKKITLELVDKSGTQLIRLDGSNHDWTKFHENFGNADYLDGPSAQIFLPAGVYSIKISGQENTKYVLVAGYKEEFPASEIFNSIFLVPKINNEFFVMNIFQSLWNVFGFMLLSIFGIIGFTSILLGKRIRRYMIENKI